MAKGKGRKRKRRKKEQVRKREEIHSTKQSPSRWWKGLLSGAAIAATLASISSGVLAVLPKLSVEVSGSLRTTDPMATIFSLSNEGYLSVYDITVTCLPFVKGNRYQIDNATFNPTDFRVAVLSPGHRVKLPCNEAIAILDASATSATLEMPIRYRPKGAFWHRTATFSFEADRSHDGTWVWTGNPK